MVIRLLPLPLPTHLPRMLWLLVSNPSETPNALLTSPSLSLRKLLLMRVLMPPLTVLTLHRLNFALGVVLLRSLSSLPSPILLYLFAIPPTVTPSRPLVALLRLIIDMLALAMFLPTSMARCRRLDMMWPACSP